MVIGGLKRSSTAIDEAHASGKSLNVVLNCFFDRVASSVHPARRQAAAISSRSSVLIRAPQKSTLHHDQKVPRIVLPGCGHLELGSSASTGPPRWPQVSSVRQSAAVCRSGSGPWHTLVREGPSNQPMIGR